MLPERLQRESFNCEKSERNQSLIVDVRASLPCMTDPMNLTINGEDREFSSNLTVSSLLTELGLKPDRVAIELNRDLLPRERWNVTPLNDGDKLEIVHFVGGGSARS